MIKHLLNSVITKYHDLPESRRTIICVSLRLRQIIELLATDKSRYFAQPRPIIANYWENALCLYIALTFHKNLTQAKIVNELIKSVQSLNILHHNPIYSSKLCLTVKTRIQEQPFSGLRLVGFVSGILGEIGLKVLLTVLHILLLKKG